MVIPQMASTTSSTLRALMRSYGISAGPFGPADILVLMARAEDRNNMPLTAHGHLAARDLNGASGLVEEVSRRFDQKVTRAVFQSVPAPVDLEDTLAGRDMLTSIGRARGFEPASAEALAR